MEKTKQELLKEWSELWIPNFNELSQKIPVFLPTDDCSLGMVPNTRTARLMMTRRWYGQIFLRLSHLKV